MLELVYKLLGNRLTFKTEFATVTVKVPKGYPKISSGSRKIILLNEYDYIEDLGNNRVLAVLLSMKPDGTDRKHIIRKIVE